MDLQKITTTGTAVAVIGGGSLMGGNYALDQATGIRIKEKAAFAAEDKELTVPISGVDAFH